MKADVQAQRRAWAAASAAAFVYLSSIKQPSHFSQAAVRRAAGRSPQRCTTETLAWVPIWAGCCTGCGHGMALGSISARAAPAAMPAVSTTGAANACAACADATVGGWAEVLHQHGQPAGPHSRRARLHGKVAVITTLRPFLLLLLLRRRLLLLWRCVPLLYCGWHPAASWLLRCCSRAGCRPGLSTCIQLRQAAAAWQAMPAPLLAAVPAAARSPLQHPASGPAAQLGAACRTQAACGRALQLALQLPGIHGT